LIERSEMRACNLCRRGEAFFLRPYSGEHLCERCFCRSIDRKVRATISKYKMLEPDDNVAVAVSGGKDSVSLLHMMEKIERTYAKAVLSAIIINEGIKGYRNEAARIAIENCDKLHVDYTMVSFRDLYGYTLDEIVRVTSDSKLAPCSYCGILRRRALNAAAREAKADKIATAHNLDDETQTYFINIVHGDPLRMFRVKPVLATIQPGFVQRIKPLCEVPEREVALYAYVKRINFQTVPCPYAGGALRNDVRNMLNRLEEKHPGVKYTVFRSVEKLRNSLEKISSKAEIRRCEICGEPTTGKTCQACQILKDLSIM